MVKSNQVIFMKGKESALKSLFETKFMYLAIGYDPEELGFEDSIDGDIESKGFIELDSGSTNGYERVKLDIVDEGTNFDPDTNKVLVKVKGTLLPENITGHRINQMAIVDNKDSSPAETTYFSATTFPTFNKTQNSSITFVIGIRL